MAEADFAPEQEAMAEGGLRPDLFARPSARVS
jgi:hypothetical protein